jgi:monoterpene epsilon-lactone hydrolase
MSLTKKETNFGQGIIYPEVAISLRSRLILFSMRIVVRRLMLYMAISSPEKIAGLQAKVSGIRTPIIEGVDIRYDKVNEVPGHVFGDIENYDQPLMLWLHGGAFMLPAAPNMHLSTAAILCKGLDGAGFMPDYRLSPQHPFPAGLDDCEQAYLGLLNNGHKASKIILVGDSAGGNLIFGLMQRIRNAGLDMPACAIAISPVTEMARIHGSPSLYHFKDNDALLPLAAMPAFATFYTDPLNSANPEVSPLYMDCAGLPPLFFLASQEEILMNDTIMLAERCYEAGVHTTCHIWPVLPHAFPIFERYFPEARKSIKDMIAFSKIHLKG